MKVPAKAFRRDCMVVINKAVEIFVGSLSKRAKEKKVTVLHAKVRSAAAMAPSNGVHIRTFPEMKEADKKPTRPLASMFGPRIDEARLSSSAPMMTPENRPYVLPYRIPIK